MRSREDFDKIANEIFFPIYEVIAQDALRILGRKNGACLDVGSGGGHLGLSVAKASDMQITLLDVKEDAIQIANNRIKDWALEGRASTLISDVRKINLPDNRFDLIISRGSIGFWGDKDEMKQSFAEIYRVLAPNGMTYVGKGFGSAELRAKITAEMKVAHPEWPQCVIEATNGFGAEDYADFLKELGIPAEIINDDRGVWIMMKKTA
jgi:ubiquinone/menaquinone biosynthesis C-methylase UbiE